MTNDTTIDTLTVIWYNLSKKVSYMNDKYNDNNSDIWYTIAEAEAILSVSKRTIQRRIKAGEIESKLEDGIRYVKLDIPVDRFGDIKGDTSPHLVRILAQENSELRQQLEYFREQFTALQADLRQERTATEEAKQRSDTIILQLTRQLEQSQRLLEHHQAPWYRRWFRRERGREEEIR